MTALAKPRKKTSGKHSFLQYFEDDKNQRLAKIGTRATADLQSCAITNPNSQVLRYLMLDLDAKRAYPCWLNDKKQLDFDKIKTHLIANFPLIFNGIEYAIRSYGGNGIHILFGFPALPLSSDTVKMQNLTSYTQRLLIKIFEHLGMGADFGSMGLRRYFSTFYNTKNVLYHNEILKKRVEDQKYIKDKSQRIPFLTNLYGAAKEAADKLKVSGIFRLHTSFVMEQKFAKLYLYLMGQKNVVPYKKLKIDFNEEVIKNFKQEVLKRFKKLSPHEEIIISFEHLNHICKIDKNCVKKYKLFENEFFLKLFKVHVFKDNRILISAKKDNRATTEKKLYRSKEVLYYIQNRGKYKPSVIRPEEVEVGQRNLATWSWALQYKLAGYSQEEATEAIELRMKYVKNETGEDNETSILQVECVVRAMYSRLRHLIGFNKKTLPDFLANDKLYGGENICSFYSHSEPRRTSRAVRPLWGYEVNSDRSTNKTDNTEKDDINKIYISKDIAKEICKKIPTGVMSSFLALCNDLKLSENDFNKVTFEPGSYVRRDGFIHFEGKYYSLGLKYYRSLGIRVFGYNEKVYIYQGETFIDSHDKFYHKYKKYFVKEHHKLGWDKIEEINAEFLYTAKEVGMDCYNYIAAYLSRCDGFSDNRFVCGILSLKGRSSIRSSSTKNLDLACKIALERKAFSYRILNQILIRIENDSNLK